MGSFSSFILVSHLRMQSYASTHLTRALGRGPFKIFSSSCRTLLLCLENVWKDLKKKSNVVLKCI